MKKKSEKRFVDKYWKRMRSHVESFVKTADQEELHQFRVQVKKLRALITMMESSSKNARLKKDFKPVKKVFKEAGAIRSAFVNLELSDQYHFKNPQFEKQQQDAIQRGTAQFNAKGFKLIKKLKRSRHRIHKDIHRLKNDVVTHFYQQNLDEAAAFFEDIKFNDELHECRKKIKFLLYNQKPAHKAIDKKMPIDKDYLDKLQDTIGKWHDNILAMDLLKGEHQADQAVSEHIRQNEEKLRNDITELTKDFKSRAFLSDRQPKEGNQSQH